MENCSWIVFLNQSDGVRVSECGEVQILHLIRTAGLKADWVSTNIASAHGGCNSGMTFVHRPWLKKETRTERVVRSRLLNSAKLILVQPVRSRVPREPAQINNALVQLSPRSDQSMFTVLLVAHCLPRFLFFFSLLPSWSIHRAKCSTLTPFQRFHSVLHQSQPILPTIVCFFLLKNLAPA